MTHPADRTVGRCPGARLQRYLAAALAVALLGAGLPSPADSYPLDGYERTGIRRLQAYRLAQEGRMRGPDLPPGALLRSGEIELHLDGVNEEFDVTEDTPRDPDLQRGLERIFAGRDPHYSVAVLDITDPENPRYAALREGRRYQPGSIGKLAVLTGLFSHLARAFPDTSRRLGVLRETTVRADSFVRTDHHDVPIVDLEAGEVSFRPIRVGDRFSLFEWIDHMVSPSANAAGSMVWKQAMLLERFGRDYPPAERRADRYFRETAPGELQDHSVRTVNAPLRELGIPGESWRQGTFFTSGAQEVIPGTSSHWTPRGLLRFLVRLEQGKVVDRWTSLEMKKLLYFTRWRYRYASSPALREAAVYFKSGSLYSCEPEPGYECAPYEGNRYNYMNSVAIVESPARGPEQRVYLVALASNVLKRNAAEEHRALGTLIERLVRRQAEGG